MRQIATLLMLCASAFACGDDAPPRVDAGTDAGEALCEPPGDPTPGSCAPAATDYRPGVDDDWGVCISDDGFYRRVEPSISSVARVMAFEEIAALLFDPTVDPSSDAFLMARAIYQEDQGLDSRVVRRFDPHFAVPAGTDCTMAATLAMFPEYCVGPAILQPILLSAFNDGIAGTEPRSSAARIEAALLWFLYASTAKESLTCTTTAKDCDSAYAYYTGGEAARCGIGLSRYVSEVDPYAHDRAWDGALALRCWRDLDSAEVAVDLARRDLARAQYDRALLHGLAAIARDRFERLEATVAGEQAYHWAFLTTLGPSLDRAMEATSAADAAVLQAELAKTDPAIVDAAAARSAIDAVFGCP